MRQISEDNTGNALQYFGNKLCYFGIKLHRLDFEDAAVVF